MILGVRRALVAALVAATLAACSDGGGPALSGRPSAEDIATAIRDGDSVAGVEADKADCAAKVIASSGMSDKAIGRYLSAKHPLYVDPDTYELTAQDSQGFDDAVIAMETECDIHQPGG